MILLSDSLLTVHPTMTRFSRHKIGAKAFVISVSQVSGNVDLSLFVWEGKRDHLATFDR